MPSIASATPIARLLLFRFVLERASSFRFFHGPTVYAFLHARLGTTPEQGMPAGVRLLAVENGRVRYGAGDAYHIAIALLPHASIGARQLIERLGRRGRDPVLDKASLGPRTRLVRVTDLVSGADITRKEEAEPLTFAKVQEAAAQLGAMRRLTLSFDSPLLVLRRPVKQRDTFLDGREFNPITFLERVKRAAQECWPLLVEPQAMPRVEVAENHLVRAETYYRGSDPQKPGQILPGAIGEVVFELDAPLGEDWAPTLLLAGLFGTGKSTAMGQGRFRVAEAPLSSQWPPRAATTFCERMARDEILARAREALCHAGSAPGVDDVEREDFLEGLTFRLPLLREALARGEHRASPLRGLLIERPDGGVRPLAIPTIEDRFLQRAAFEELGPALEELFEETSFAYRRGLSRRNAEQRVRQVYDEGFGHVLEADLRGFYDRVDWSILRQRLRAYLGLDPAVDLLMRWVEAPVEFGDRLIQRKQGLPQGAVVSPLLANLFLDCFDEAIENEGLRLVRYADDFVVLCKSPDDARRAREVVERELARIKLELAPEKTGVTSFDQGFELLGYVFARSISLEKKREHGPARVISSPDELAGLGALDPAKARGWLADWIDMVPVAHEADLPRFQPVLAPASRARRSVYVVQPGLRLTGSRRGLRVYDGETLLDEVAWSTLSEIAVLGQRAMAPSFFQRAMQERVPVALYTRGGKPVGVVLPDRVRTPSATTRIQWLWNENMEGRLQVARALVEAKIHNQRLLARRQPGDNEQLRDRLGLLASQATRAERLDRLRGLEGAAAHAYFATWPKWLPAELGFQGRSGRGATDPINALLNLIYTQLFHRCWLSCVVQGLDPYLGVLHEGQERYAALAADLQEPFRFLADRLVLDLFHKKRVGAGDFARQEKPAPMTRLKPDALKLVLGEWERRLESRVRAADETTHTYRGHIMAQTQRLAELMKGERQSFGAFLLKW